MHRMHCGSNKVRRGSWPPQVSFVSRLLPPTEWPWPWGTRPTAVWWAWWAAPGWRAPARRARRGAVIPMRLADCWEVQLRAERLCRTSRSIQPAAGGLARWACTGASGRAAGGRAGTVEWIDIGLRPWSRGLGLAVQPDGDLELLLFKLSAKGQLISKCPYEKSVLSKIPTKKFPRFLS